MRPIVNEVDADASVNLQDLKTVLSGCFTQSTVRRDYARSMRQKFDALLPTQAFFTNDDKTQTEASTLGLLSVVDSRNMLLYMLSNKFDVLNSDLCLKTFNWTKQNSNAEDLGNILSIGGPAAEALIEAFFSTAIREHDVRSVRYLLSLGFNINKLKFSVGYDGLMTPLQYASKLRQLDMVQILLSAGAEVNRRMDCHPYSSVLSLAIKGTDMNREHVDVELVRTLLIAGAEVHSDHDPSPLCEAAASCHLEVINLLLEAGADPNCNPYESQLLYSREATADPNFNPWDSATPLSRNVPLVEAIMSKKPEQDIISVVASLLDAGADVNAENSTRQRGSDSPLELAVPTFYFTLAPIPLIRMLLQKGAQITKKAFKAATMTGQLRLIELFLEFGARTTPSVVAAAVVQGKREVLSLLLNTVEENLKEQSHTAAFIAAIHHGRKDLFDSLSAAGVRLKGSTTLARAIENAVKTKSISILQHLLGNDSAYRVVAIESLGSSVSLAISEGAYEIVDLLLTMGADVNATDFCNDSPLLEAVLRKDVQLVRRLLAAGAMVNEQASDISYDKHCLTFGDGFDCGIPITVSVLPLAVAWGDHSVIQDLIVAGADVNAPGVRGGRTALTVAVEKGDHATVKLLIEAGANVNIPVAALLNDTALAAAVNRSDLDMVRHLLDIGADPDEKSLTTASTRSMELTKLLITTRIARYQRISRGYGCHTLQHAIAASNTDIIELLLSYGVDPNVIVRPQWGEEEFDTQTSALGTAIKVDEDSRLSIVCLLLDAGADPSQIVWEEEDYYFRRRYPSESGVLQPFATKTALLMAIEHEDLNLIAVLITAGAELNPKSISRVRKTPLQQAAQQGHLDIVKMLIAKGADVNAPPFKHRGATALQWTAIKGYTSIACVLLQHGADVNAPPASFEGRTAVEGACEHGRIDVLQLLLDAGAMLIDSGNAQYKRAREFASENGHIAAQRLLDTYHAQQLSGFSISDTTNKSFDLIQDLEPEIWTKWVATP